MKEEFSRTQLLYGAAAMEQLSSCRVAVFGVGGVGGYVVEALVRSGIGALDLIDLNYLSVPWSGIGQKREVCDGYSFMLWRF